VAYPPRLITGGFMATSQRKKFNCKKNIVRIRVFDIVQFGREGELVAFIAR